MLVPQWNLISQRLNIGAVIFMSRRSFSLNFLSRFKEEHFSALKGLLYLWGWAAYILTATLWLIWKSCWRTEASLRKHPHSTSTITCYIFLEGDSLIRNMKEVVWLVIISWLICLITILIHEMHAKLSLNVLLVKLDSPDMLRANIISQHCSSLYKF